LIEPWIIACLYADNITDRENKIIEKSGQMNMLYGYISDFSSGICKNFCPLKLSSINMNLTHTHAKRLKIGA
jgi:hypothetical protein